MQTILKYGDYLNERNVQQKTIAWVSTVEKKQTAVQQQSTAFAIQLNWQEAKPASHATK